MINVINTVYVLRHRKSGKFLFPITHDSSNGDFCNETYVELIEKSMLYEDFKMPWNTPDEFHANYVRCFSTPWYNADIRNPKHSFDADDLEIVKLNMTIGITPLRNTKTLSVMELYKIVYRDDPEHFKYLETQKNMSAPSWSEIEYARKKKVDRK